MAEYAVYLQRMRDKTVFVEADSEEEAHEKVQNDRDVTLEGAST